MYTVSRTIVAAVALLTLLVSTSSESFAAPICKGRRCRQPVAHAPTEPRPQRPTSPAVTRPAPQCTLPNALLPNLRRCPKLGHDRANGEYSCDIQNGMKLIDTGLEQKIITPIKLCRLVTGELRSTCCNDLRTAAIQRCQQEVAANARRDRKCEFVRPCSRQIMCPLQWRVEELRATCCESLKPQGVKLLKAYCEARVNTLTASCSKTMLPQPSDGNVTIQPVGTPIEYDPGSGSSLGDLPNLTQDGSTSLQ
jgi:hypothetical protein